MNSNFKKKEKEKATKKQKIENYSSSDNWKMDVQDFAKNGCLLNGASCGD